MVYKYKSAVAVSLYYFIQSFFSEGQWKVYFITWLAQAKRNNETTAVELIIQNKVNAFHQEANMDGTVIFYELKMKFET